MSVLHLDYETYSAADLRKVGAYRYAADPTTEVLIACWAVDDGPVRVWLPWQNPQPPRDFTDAIQAVDYVGAHNAEFERQITIHVLKLGQLIARARWRCTAVRAAAAGLPRGLGDALKVTGHPQQKDPRGKRLVRIFCMPRKPGKRDTRTRIHPQDKPEEFGQFVEYCKQDVRSERALHQMLPDLPQHEWSYYHYNCLLNDRGLPLDVPLVKQTLKALAAIEAKNVARVNELTGGLNPTQRDKMLEWFRIEGEELRDLKLKTLQRAVREANGSMDPRILEVIDLRLEASKASVKKLSKMLDVVHADQRARGTLLFYGAHTGRNSGKLIQPHNFARGLLTHEQQLRVLQAYRTGDHELVEMMYDKPLDVLSQSIRGFIKAPKGYRFVIADYKAIEMWTLGWAANEEDLLEIHRRNMRLPPEQRLDVYQLFAAENLYHVPYAQVSKEQRRIGKNIRLGAGYQLSGHGLLKNAAKEEIEMERDFAFMAIDAWREANPNTVNLWYRVQDAAIDAVTAGPRDCSNVHFHKWRDWLAVTLPSQRNIFYYQPKVVNEYNDRRGRIEPKLTYAGYVYIKIKDGKAVESDDGGIYGQEAPTRKIWGRPHTYGGKLVENIIQAMARDLLMHGMIEAERAGYPVVGNVHDEIITLRKDGEGTVAELETAICKLPPWAKGLPLMAEGFECVHYHKG